MNQINYDYLNKAINKIDLEIDKVIIELKNNIKQLHQELLKTNIDKIYLFSDFGHIDLRFIINKSSYRSWDNELESKGLDRIFLDLINYINDNEYYFLISIKDDDNYLTLWEK